MSIGLKKNLTPITQIQTQISDFSDNLKPFCNLLEEKLFPILFRHHMDRRLTRNNNPTEQMNLDIEKYPSLKNHMKPEAGVNMILDGEVFLHNFNV